MDENKKQPEGAAGDKADHMELFPEKELHLFDLQDNAGVTVVRNEPDKHEEKRQKTKKRRKEKKTEKKQKYPHAVSFLLGLIILIFAFIGIILTVWNSIRYIKSTTDSGSEFAQYNTFLAPIAAVDPDSFDDIADADTEQLLNSAIWAILNNDSTPDTYAYSGGYLMIPSKDVESVYGAIFGNDSVKNIVHQTVHSYNCTFEYNASALVYQIPVTAISPIYTPQVTKVEESGSSLIITVNYLAAESWNQDAEGNFIAPEPDKVMSITLREADGVYFVSSIKTVSATVPDIVIPEQSVAPTEAASKSDTQSAETTTARLPEKVTLGGRT